MENWNTNLFYKIYNKRNKSFTSISWLISNNVFLILFCAVLVIWFLILKQDWSLTWKLITNLLLVLFSVKFIVDKVIKKIFYQPRPYISKDHINPIGKAEKNSTVPSGHSTVVTTGVITLIAYNPWFLLLLPLIPLIMWSRVYNGMHWPIDTILGVILGLAIADLSLIVINLIF